MKDCTFFEFQPITNPICFQKNKNTVRFMASKNEVQYTSWKKLRRLKLQKSANFGDVSVEELRLKAPSTLVLAGSSGTGKTSLLLDIVRNETQCFSNVPEKYLFIYEVFWFCFAHYAFFVCFLVPVFFRSGINFILKSKKLLGTVQLLCNPFPRTYLQTFSKVKGMKHRHFCAFVLMISFRV